MNTNSTQFHTQIQVTLLCELVGVAITVTTQLAYFYPDGATRNSESTAGIFLCDLVSVALLYAMETQQAMEVCPLWDN